KAAEINRDTPGNQRILARMDRFVDSRVAEMVEAVEKVKTGDVGSAFYYERRRVHRRRQSRGALLDQRRGLAIKLCQVKADAEGRQQNGAQDRPSKAQTLQRAAQPLGRRPAPPACALRRALCHRLRRARPRPGSGARPLTISRMDARKRSAPFASKTLAAK